MKLRHVHIARREKWGSIGRVGKTWVETGHNLILGLKVCNNKRH